MKTKIIFIVQNLRCGGAPKVLSLLCAGLDNEKYDVVLVCINMIDTFYEIKNPAVRIVNLDKMHIRDAAIQLFRLLKKEKPDIVFTNGQDLNILAGVYKIYFRKKVLFVCRETSVLSGNNRNIQRGAFSNFLIKRLYNRLDMIVCQSREMFRDLKENYYVNEKRLRIISNPVEAPAVSESKSVFKKEAGIKLLSAGRLSYEKGNMRLLGIINKLRIPYELILLGDGPERADLETEVKKLGMTENVVFKGAVTDTNNYIADCDFVVLATYNEGFPNIVLETGILGKPVIAFKVQGVDEEVIENGVTGILVPGKNPEDFRNAIETSGKFHFEGDKIRDRTSKKYGIKKIIADYDALFNELKRK